MTLTDLLQSLSLLALGVAVLRSNRKPRRQTQTSGHNSVQFQTGGSLTVDETAEHRAERIARDIIKNGRHL